MRKVVAFAYVLLVADFCSVYKRVGGIEMKREAEVKEQLISNAIHLIAHGGFEKATTKELTHCGGHLPDFKMNEEASTKVPSVNGIISLSRLTNAN